MNAPEVIVVGAGPVGLTVALGLAREGRRVLVLEKEAGTAEHSRAPAIWPRTQEILAELGVLDPFLAEGLTVARLRIWDADRDAELLSIPLDELKDRTRHPRLLILPQPRTERILLDALQSERDARVLFDASVLGMRQSPSSVTVDYRRDGRHRSVEAPFAVGCDGARSTVRESLSVALEGTTYDLRVALADVIVPGSGDLPFPRLSTADGLALGIRIGESLWRLVLPFAEEGARPPDERVERAVGHLFGKVAAARDCETTWRSEFRIHRRIASRFVRGRVALAGDAAHLNSPVGGQGMNAGIQDAEALVLALVDALDAGNPAPLRAYDRRRRSSVRTGVNSFTDFLTRYLLLGRGRTVRPGLSLARRMLRIGPLRRRFLLRIAMLGPR